ncbi:TATA box-binding protein-associated factor RNA polymerase I subunit A isoform X2 [Aplysia californica]|nr:TATA box-binding protein-associated factor RNA polymerase I subunit A isoform X2 [Aplysia californica]
MDQRNVSKLPADDQQRKKEMLEFLELLRSFSKMSAVYHRRRQTHKLKADFRDFLPRFTHLLRECVVNHQWPQALQLIHALTTEHYRADTSIYHVGMAALYQVQEDRTPMIDQFVKQVCRLRQVVSVEVYLDYLLYLINFGSLEEAKDLIQDMKRSTYTVQINTEKRREAQTLFYAYQGLVLYVEWKLMVSREQDQDLDEDVVSQMMSQGMSSQVARSTAESAMEYLVELKDKAGIFDVFVTSLVEMYNYYDIDAREILETYRKNNPTNPNAHRYMFEFEASQAASAQTQIDYLKSLMQLDPSNQLALTLFDLMGPECVEAVEVLFDYLDFDHCSNDLEAWSRLATALKQLPDNNELLTVVTKCWEMRKDWWPQVKFDIVGQDAANNKDLRKYQRRVKRALLELG